MLRSGFLFFLLLIQYVSYGQNTIIVEGTAFDSANPTRKLEDLMVINLRTSQGTFGKSDGSFKVSVNREDTIMIASNGYEFKRIAFADSVEKPVYTISVALTKLNITLRAVDIFSARDLQSIYKDIQRLGYNKKDFELSGVDALNSPITFLYQQFSSLERLKAHNRERINEDKKRQLLKELLANYVSYEIINLDNFEFDDFIDFCNVPETYMKSASQYDFCIFIKQKYEVYAMLKSRK
jgi:hypothetical protein